MSTSSLRRLAPYTFIAASLFFTVLAAPAPVRADAPSVASVSGSIASDDGTPIGGAIVTVRGARGNPTVSTDPAGYFSIGGLAPGVYTIGVRASGFNPLTGLTVGAGADGVPVALVLSRTASSLITIARMQVTTGNALSTSTVPTTTIATQTYARHGFTRVSDVLDDDVSTTLVHPLGGGSTVLPTSVALRGPDPTETLVDIDGHQVNSGNTGDFDLSLLDPTDYANVELVKGISPSSLIAPNTIDGAINIRTLEPTAKPHSLVRFYVGSYNSFGETLQSTATYDRVGYAFSLHRATAAGEVGGTVLDANDAYAPATVGSATRSSTALGKVRYAFGRSGDGYVELSVRDQSQFRDLSAALSTIPESVDPTTAPSGIVANSSAGSSLLAHNAGFGVDVNVPLGSASSGLRPYDLLVRHYTSYVSQSVAGPGADSSPYLYNDRDRIDDESIELDRQFSRSSLTLRYDLLNEALRTDFVSGVVSEQSVRRGLPALQARVTDIASGGGAGGLQTAVLGQTQRFAALRYTYDPTSQLHFTAAGYYSRYSTFGTSLDPRFGVSYTPDARSVVRFSLGTTYQSPNLPELYVAPNLPTVVGQAITIGNPNLKPDHATEYGFGFEHRFEVGAHATSLSLDLYRVNLRTPAALLRPDLDPQCGPTSAGGDGATCPFAMTVNAGDAVYRGFELQGQRRVRPFTTMKAGYAVRSAYLTNVGSSIQNGSLVVGEQSLGLPLQKGSFEIAHAPPMGFTYAAGLTYEGRYNELNQPPFATVRASAGYSFETFDLTLSGTNLTDVFDRHFTHLGAGVPYGGTTGPIATNAYSLQGAAFNLSLTRRL